MMQYFDFKEELRHKQISYRSLKSTFCSVTKPVLNDRTNCNTLNFLDLCGLCSFLINNNENSLKKTGLEF